MEATILNNIRHVSLSGAKIFEKVSVEKIEVRNGRVHGVKTNRGDISCDVFVNCAGQVSPYEIYMYMCI